MAYTTVNKSTDYFNTKLYTGTGSSNAISGVGFKPDLVWSKARSEARGHNLNDIVRGASKWIGSNDNSTEQTVAQGVTSFDSDGFTVGTGNDVNKNTITFASWNWLAGGSQGSSNTDGSINTTYTSVNTTAGFSISKYVGNDTAGATVGHGLGVTPAMIMVKRLSGSAQNWRVYHKEIDASAPQDYDLKLNLTNARDNDNTTWNDTAPSSTVFTIGNSSTVNGGGGADSYIAYCFAEKTGYSKFGSYVGNGNADGSFIYTGFKPAFLFIKIYSGTGQWTIFDNKRSSSGGGNEIDKILHPNVTNTENTADDVDFLSNGFKMRNTAANANGSGSTYIYMAIGQSLVGSNNVPCTAR